jgi:16S rRNA (uracil1498-N3)-methyltransferase
MRCYVPPENWRTDVLELDADETHHLAHVMRARVGDEVVVMDGAGRLADTRIAKIERHRAVLEVLLQRSAPRPRPHMTLIQAVPREQKLDYVIQKATELGVAEIVPVTTEYTVVRIREGGEEAKQERWWRIALGAAKQSGSAWIPDVRAVVALDDYLAHLPKFDLFLHCSLEPDAPPLRSVIDAVRGRDLEAVAVLVGPEGDFSARECAAARQAGGRPVSLGDLTLRSETASLYALSILRYELTLRTGGQPLKERIT